MRFLRGLLLGLLMTGIWVGLSAYLAFYIFLLPNSIAPIEDILAVSFLSIFIFPIYYWIIEPLLNRRKRELADVSLNGK